MVFFALMNPIDDVIVQQLLIVVVQGGGHLLVPQPGVLPDLLQGVVLHQAAVLEHRHQQVLRNTAEHTGGSLMTKLLTAVILFFDCFLTE